jgi:hypothetical protein
MKYSTRHTRNDGSHVSQGKEGKLLRRLMSQTGMNETEIRGIKKYRKMLANCFALQAPKGHHNTEREFRALTKIATKKTGLALSHPETIEQIKMCIDQCERNGCISHRTRNGWQRALSHLIKTGNIY